MSDAPIRLLVIDDSAYNRSTIASFFDDVPQVTVVGKAMDGQEGLELAFSLRPTVITVDLEMPRLDGFSFLRLLMASAPTAVIVISSHGAKENVFRSLELGALDFVAKPPGKLTDIHSLKHAVVRTVLSAAKYNPAALQAMTSGSTATAMFRVLSEAPPAAAPPAQRAADKLIVIGASTGGPATLTKIVSALPAGMEAGILIAQHMPPQFTTTFAQRLDKVGALAATEVQRRELVLASHIYVAPGDADMVVSGQPGRYYVERTMHRPQYRYQPSIDRLFSSAAAVASDNLMAVVLTGMGDDGTRGAHAVFSAGGSVLVESSDSALISGMPDAVLRAGIPASVRPLHLIANSLTRFAGTRTE